jgi:hypothetical protein
MRLTRIRFACALALLLVAAWPAPSSAQWVIETKDQKANLKIGFLIQPQLEAITAPSGSGESVNLFLRRFRILFGGKVSDKWTYFFETDSPNLGKGAATTGVKDTGTIYMQDAFVTYNHNASFRVDTGMLLLAQSHNHIQSAASLLPVDYGAYSFVESAPLQGRVGRDYGVQVRGIPGGHFEYRLGVFQGIRGTDSKNGLRVAGRGTWFPFAAEAGYFYTGTFQGQKRMVAIGASFDKQKEYGNYGFDAFVEQPFNKGEQGLTAQLDWNRIDGSTFITALPKQDLLVIELGAHFGKGKYSPFFQYSKRTFDVVTPASQNQYAFQVGAAWWMAGHNRNLKLSAGKQHTDLAPDRTQILLQLQIFYY